MLWLGPTGCTVKGERAGLEGCSASPISLHYPYKYIYKDTAGEEI